MGDSDNNSEQIEKVSGLGDFLRSEREKQGLSREDMVRIIRIRDHFIHALENEDWESLPSPVFIKGFIRSYTKALGMDFSKALILYEKSGPKKEESPQPLIEPEKPRKYLLFLLILFFFVGATLLTYLWINHSRIAELAPETSAPADRENNIIEEETVPSDHDEQAQVQLNDLLVKEEDKDIPEEAIPVEVEDSSVEKMDKNFPIEVQGEHENIEAEESSLDEERVESGMDIFISSEPVIPDHEEPETLPVDELLNEEPVVSEPLPEEVLPASGNNASSFPLTLTGIVSMRTYVKIYVDDNLPKEYIFRPGSRPQWEATEGFDIVIGNAGGIMFDFNGEIIQDLGSPGKVIRLRLPEDFESKFFED